MTNKGINETVAPTEEKRVRTTLNLRQTHIDGLSTIAFGRKATLTATIDEAFSIALAQMNDTTIIAKMINLTNGFWFERNLERAKDLLSVETAQNLTAFQKAYLYFYLKDQADCERVFEGFSLKDDIDDINAIASCLEKASVFSGSELKGYNIPKLSNEIHAKLSQLQLEYLRLKLGNEAIANLQERIPDKFPDTNGFSDSEETPFNENTMNPALPTVLAVTMLTKAAWRALPDSLKRKVHDAVKFGKTELAKKLVSSTETESEGLELLAEDELENV